MEVLEKIRGIKFKDNVVTPVSISEIPELENMGSYELIMDNLKKGRLFFNLPNHLIHDTYSLISSKRHKRLNNFTFQLPFIFTLIMVIYGLLIGNYWLLTLIPVLLISIYFSHQVRNQRRSFLMKLSLINEELFCFIFFSRSLTITDNRSGKNIYSGMN